MIPKSYLNGDYLSKNPNWHEEDADWKANKINCFIKKNKRRN